MPKKKVLKKSSWKVSRSFRRIKNKKQQYGCERYKNLTKVEKQKLIEYRMKYHKTRKNKKASQIKTYNTSKTELFKFFLSKYKKLFVFR